jgi:photosystem II stability/assembly factor-like uncharacterized protein
MKNYSIIPLLFLWLLFSCRPEGKKKEQPIPLGWELVETPTISSLRGISPLTEKIVWASGSNGTWLRTLDGGVTWDYGVIDGLDSVDFRDIEAFDAGTAVAISAGQPALVYRTEDGGQHWERIFQGGESDFFDGIAFYRNLGYIIGDEVGGKWRILVSRDKGKSWKELESSPKASPGSGSFAASGSSILAYEDHVWFASGGLISNIFHSKDRGVSWEEVPTPIIQGESSQGIFSLIRIDQNILFAVGGDYLQPAHSEKNAIISSNLGKNWSLISGDFPSGFRSGVCYFPLQHWLISVGPNGSDFSLNSGQDWKWFSEEALHAVLIDKTQSSVWASGPNGKIAKLLY